MGQFGNKLSPATLTKLHHHVSVVSGSGDSSAGVAGVFSPQWSALCADSYFSIHSTPVLQL